MHQCNLKWLVRSVLTPVLLLPLNPLVAGADDGSNASQPATAPAFAEPTPSAVRNGLRLQAAVKPAVVSSGTDIELSLTLLNDGSKEGLFFRPEHFDTDSVLDWRFIHADGRVFVPHWSGYQSARGKARPYLGDLLRIPQSASVPLTTSSVRLVHATESGRSFAAWRAPFPPGAPMHLPPGDYRVVFTFEKADQMVPTEEPPGHQARIEGLWTGKIRSNEVALRVTPKTEPWLDVHRPTRVIRGQSCPLSVVVQNPTAQPLHLRGAFVLEMHNKGTGAQLRFRPPPQFAPLGKGETCSLDVPANGEFKFDFDVARFPVTLSRAHDLWGTDTRKSGEGRTVSVWQVAGLPGYCRVSWVDENGQTRMRSELAAVGASDTPASRPSARTQAQ